MQHAKIRVQRYLNGIGRIFCGSFALDGISDLHPIRGVKTYDGVKADFLLLGIQIEAVHLFHVRVGKGKSGDFFANPDDFRIFCVFRVDADTGEEYAVVRSSGSSEKTRLRSGDTVIAVARNLYDGKVVS